MAAMPPESDPFDLARFTRAQQDVYLTARAEISAGQKRTHWMWFIFPQVAGLGHSATSQYFAISGLAEARALLNHPLLGARLRQCVAALPLSPRRTAEAVFGMVDARKLHSSLTMFVMAGGGAAFQAALDHWFAGEMDLATVRLLSTAAQPL